MGRSTQTKVNSAANINRLVTIASPEEVPGSGRRGSRKRVKPLEYWNNEMPIYTAEGSLEQVQQVGTSPLLKGRQGGKLVANKETKPRRKKQRAQQRTPKTPKSHRIEKLSQETPNIESPDASDIDEMEPERLEGRLEGMELEGFRKEAVPMAIVKDALSGEDITIPIVKSAKMLEFGMCDDESLIATAFEGVGWRCGVLLIPPQARTTAVSSGDKTQVCVVLSGQIQVSIHKSHFVLAMGGQFFVPPHNIFAIRNLSHSRDCRVCLTGFTTLSGQSADEP